MVKVKNFFRNKNHLLQLFKEERKILKFKMMKKKNLNIFKSYEQISYKTQNNKNIEKI